MQADELTTCTEASVLGISATTVVHSAGHGTEALWSAVTQGRTGLRRNDLPWCDLGCWIGSVPGVDETRLPVALRRWDCRNHRLAWLALRDGDFRHAVTRAIADCGAHRIGLVLGTSTSGIRSTEIAYAQRLATGNWPPDLDFRSTHAVEALCRFTAEVLGLTGPMVTISTACSSSAKVFMIAQRWIHAGLIDAAVVGGVDSLCLSTLHGFHSLQLLSEEICRPFDTQRGGIAIGEAAGFALLDSTPANVSLAGGGESSDAWHMSAPHPEGLGAQEAMRAALAAAELTAEDVDYVNAHGTGTLANDRAEAAALQAVFGDHGVPVSSTKGITGHTLAAAGIVEAILTVRALDQQTLPPSANLRTLDPALALDVVAQPRIAALRHAMTNSFGFGGTNCSLIFSRSN